MKFNNIKSALKYAYFVSVLRSCEAYWANQEIEDELTCIECNEDLSCAKWAVDNFEEMQDLDYSFVFGC